MDDKKEIESANNQPAKAIDVARYLIGFAQNDGKPVDNLRLQKLLYYAWGTYWYNKQQELFSDDIEAWPFGPVVREVYVEYYNEVDPKCNLAIGEEELEEVNKNLCDDVRNFLKNFNSLYKDEDTFSLVNASHRERPWKETYEEGEKNIINREVLKEFFKKEAF